VGVSTDIYLECTDHDPPIRSEDESGQHLYDLPKLRKVLEDPKWREPNDDPREWDYDSRADMWHERKGWFHISTVKFLRQHPRCNLKIIDELGREHPLKEDE
jgi:hypothetical protein